MHSLRSHTYKHTHTHANTHFEVSEERIPLFWKLSTRANILSFKNANRCISVILTNKLIYGPILSIIVHHCSQLIKMFTNNYIKR